MTQNRIIYIKEAAYPRWQPYVRYYVEGAKVMFTFDDGSCQIWCRGQ